MNPYTGSHFDEFLKKEGILEEVTVRAHKRLLALQFADAMRHSKMTKSELAELYAEFTDEDGALAEEGMDDFARSLAAEDAA